MKHLRKFKTVGDMDAAITADYVSFVGMVKDDGQAPILHLHVHKKPKPAPTNLSISCSENTVTITADNATTIEYNFDGSSTYTAYTAPFEITQTVTVYAKATNTGGSVTASQECRYTVPKTTPFYVEDVSGSANTVQIKKNTSNAPTLAIEKSTDGNTWASMGNTSTTAITATIPANGKLYLRCNAATWGSSSGVNMMSTTANCNVGGNIMSLLYGSSFTGNETTFPSGSTYTFHYLFYKSKIIKASELLLPAATLTNYCYSGMFRNCTSLTTAPELPATTLANYCYQEMFKDCISLTDAPDILPATTLVVNCYSKMFSGCTSLTAAPELPATTLAESCYASMFSGCTSLTTAPAILPATTLANNCYIGMFQGCTSLTTAPTLPATTMVNNCYGMMFSDCTSLTTAPELPATTLADNCYEYMFNGCTNLNYIKCLATNKSASNCLSNWVKNVSASGTFVKNSSMSSWTTGVNGIPKGWTVKDAGSISLEQNLNVATITISDLDEGTGYYTINGGSHISIGNGKTTIPITQGMNGQVLLVHGEFSGEPSEDTLTLSWTDYSPSVTITETSNYVTIVSPNADVIKYKLGSSGSFTTYTEPVYINADTTIYVQATKTVSGVDYTTNTSQEVTHEPILPTNLVISCTNNFVTITATGADTLEYNMNGGTSFYTTYTGPFHITESGTVNARATNADGSITASQAVTYIDYRPTISITEANNFVTVTATGANTILYRLGTISEYVAYTGPVYIAENTTIYVQATRTVAGVEYTSTVSQAVTHEIIPPTNLVISCASNTVTITADNATTIEYNFDGSSTYTTYAEPFKITQTVTVYAKASNVDGSITASQECEYSSIPFESELIFYAPLTEGDLTDHISKASLTNYGSNVTWDSTKGMYNFAAVTKANEMYFPVDLSTKITNNTYTILAEIQNPTYATHNYPAIIVIGGYSDSAAGNDGSWRPSLANLSKMTNQGLSRSSRMYFVYITNGTTQYSKAIYNNTVYTISIESTVASAKLSNWNALMKSRVAMNPSRRDGYIYNSYIKDARIYNFALTDAQLLEAINI